jgi:hypothetical protein
MPYIVNTRTESYFDNDNADNNKNNSTTNNSNNVLVIRLLFKVFIHYGVVKSDNQLSTGFKSKIV